MNQDSPSRARFARIREEFHRLLDLDVARRAAALQDLRAQDAALAEAVDGLFRNLDQSDLQAPDTDWPERIGPWRVIGLIGRGGMGEVYRAERADADYQQEVAIKRIRGGIAGLGLDGRFVRERQILARLQHPRIARLVDGGTLPGGGSWLAMELVPGEDLAAWVTERSPDLRRRVALFVRICDAVAFAHRSLVVHRDLKPANILINADDEPKLLDFGIAKLIEDEDAPTITQAAGLTLRYAAPEQVLGDRTTTSSDVYALGVLLFELLARQSPYRLDAAEASWQQAILSASVRPLRACLGESRLESSDQRRALDLQPVIARAMARQMTDRYPSASALAEDLQDWLDGEPFRSGVGGRAFRLRQELWRWRYAVLSVSAVLAALLVGGLLALQQHYAAREQSTIAEANMQGMLDVLGELEVIDYTEPDPVLSKALVTAAERVGRDPDQRPEYRWRVLGAIGRTLYNRHRPDLAAPVLAQTERALALDEQAPRVARFDFALMAVSAAPPVDAVDRDAALTRIGQLASPLDAGKVLAETSTTAYGLSIYGHHEVAIGLIETIWPRRDGSALALEDWNQFHVFAAEVAWRAGRIDRARDAVASIRHDGPVSTDRVTAWRLAAELALQQSDAAAAEFAIRAAQQLVRNIPEALPPGDSERLLLTETRLALLRGDHERAQTLLLQVHRHLDTTGSSRHTRGEWRARYTLGAGLAVQQGDCDLARQHWAKSAALLNPQLRPAAPERAERDDVEAALASCRSQAQGEAG